MLSGCAGTGWDHTPMNYGEMLSNNEKLGNSISIEIVDTAAEANQSMVYAGAGFLIGRQWSYEQLEILNRLSKETQIYLNSDSNEPRNKLILLVSGIMKNDFRGNYIATLKAQLITDKKEIVSYYEVQGIVKSHVASPIAFENAFKVAFDTLASELATPNKSSKQDAVTGAPS